MDIASRSRMSVPARSVEDECRSRRRKRACQHLHLASLASTGMCFELVLSDEETLGHTVPQLWAPTVIHVPNVPIALGPSALCRLHVHATAR